MHLRDIGRSLRGWCFHERKDAAGFSTARIARVTRQMFLASTGSPPLDTQGWSPTVHPAILEPTVTNHSESSIHHTNPYQGQ